MQNDQSPYSAVPNRRGVMNKRPGVAFFKNCCKRGVSNKRGDGKSGTCLSFVYYA